MTTETNDFEVRITDSVQGALNQFSDDVRLNLTSLREELRIERAARHEMEKHLKTMASAIEQTHRNPSTSGGRDGAASAETEALISQLIERLDRLESNVERNRADSDERVNRLIDDANSSLPAIVESSVRELERTVEHRQATSDNALEKLNERINNFDVQTARMVEYFSETTTALGARIDAVPDALPEPAAVDASAIDARIEALQTELSSLHESSRKKTAEQIDAVERRVDEKVTGAIRNAEERTGQQLADMDAFLGNTGHGLDDAIAMLSDRISELDGRLQELSHQRAIVQQAPVQQAPVQQAPVQHAPVQQPHPVAAVPEQPAPSRPAVVFNR